MARGGSNKQQQQKGNGKQNLPPATPTSDNAFLQAWNHVTIGMDDTTKYAAVAITVVLILLGFILPYFLFGKKSKKKNMKIQYSNKLVLSPRAKTNNTSSSSSTSPAAGKSTAAADSDMRGYKKTADGRTTTYFNREMTEEEKRLIGDTTPKPIVDGAVGSPGTGAGSVWNAGGTWEEKSHSPWASAHLRELLTSASIKVPATSSTSKDVVR
jgi:hypothetical protein